MGYKMYLWETPVVIGTKKGEIIISFNRELSVGKK